MTSANRLAAYIRSETSLIGYPLLNKKERHAFYAKLLGIPLISFATLFNHPFQCDHRSVVWPHSWFYLTSARSRLTHTSLCWMCLNQAINRTKKASFVIYCFQMRPTSSHLHNVVALLSSQSRTTCRRYTIIRWPIGINQLQAYLENVRRNITMNS